MFSRENIMEVRLYYESLVYKTFEKVQKITFIDILGESLSLSLHEILCFVSDAFFYSSSSKEQTLAVNILLKYRSNIDCMTVFTYDQRQ